MKYILYTIVCTLAALLDITAKRCRKSEYPLVRWMHLVFVPHRIEWNGCSPEIWFPLEDEWRVSFNIYQQIDPLKGGKYKKFSTCTWKPSEYIMTLKKKEVRKKKTLFDVSVKYSILGAPKNFSYFCTTQRPEVTTTLPGTAEVPENRVCIQQRIWARQINSKLDARLSTWVVYVHGFMSTYCIIPTFTASLEG